MLPRGVYGSYSNRRQKLVDSSGVDDRRGTGVLLRLLIGAAARDPGRDRRPHRRAKVAYGYVAVQLSTLLGAGSAQIVLAAVRSSQTQQGTIATLVSIATLIIGATTVFAVLELALEQMWGIETRISRGWRGFVRTRLMSLGVILALGFLLLVSLSITTAVSSLHSVSLRSNTPASCY
jgi:hypothetical protein